MKHLQHQAALLLALLFTFSANAGSNRVEYVENGGQWESNVLYQGNLVDGKVYAERNRLTYVFYSREDLEAVHELADNSANPNAAIENSIIRAHAIRVSYLNSNTEVSISASDIADGILNYFTGNDPSKWASNLHAYHSVNYSNLYEGIDMKLYSNQHNLEYDFIVNPGRSVSTIAMRYDGAEDLSISEGNLLIRTSVNTVTELMPVAYQVVNSQRVAVRCNYVLNGNTVTFETDPYDTSIPLVIDPVLVASTYMGSSVDSWGQCASYDDAGNPISAGRCFGTGYPVTVGAFQVNFSGNIDMSISKMTPTGSARVYATYLGGSGADYAQNMSCTVNGDLYVYGSSNSTNFPVTIGCYDNTFNGGYDIVITHFNSTGSALVGSTYVGGQMDDGYGVIGLNAQDYARGQVIENAGGEIFVASFSSSLNFPFTVGSYSTINHGGMDAVVFKLNPTCSSLLWSTSLGGSGTDEAYSVALATNGDVVVSGVTTSQNFPSTSGAYRTTYQGGNYDAFVSHLSGNGANLVASTFFGNTGNDEALGLSLDGSDNVYIAGYNSVAYTISSGVYGNANSGTFIAKLNPALSSLQWQTAIGNGMITEHLVVNGFMIDDCGNIYLSGFTGFGSGYPVTSNALYSSSSIGNYHLTILSPNATSFLYGTYYGGTHAHGGASNLDKRGTVYQTVCITSGFPTLPGSYATTNPFGVFQNPVFKIDNQGTSVQASASLSASSQVSSVSGCAPLLVNFYNNSNGNSYIWDFGDGSPQVTTTTATHTYTVAGNYTAMLIAYGTGSCNGSDTAYLTINVDAVTLTISPNIGVCAGSGVMLQVGGASTYVWSPSTGLSSTTDSIVVCIPTATTTYTVVGTSVSGCTDTATVTVTYNVPPVAVINPPGPLQTCSGNPTMLYATQGSGYSYMWFQNGIPVIGAGADSLAVTTSGNYFVIITDANGCSGSSTSVSVTQGIGPVVTISATGGTCGAGVILIGYSGAPIILTANAPGAITYTWSTGATTQSITVNQPGTYTVVAYDINGCPSTGPGGSYTVTAVNVACGHNGNKVILCHVPPGNPGNPQTICVAASSIPWHLQNHPDDCIGPCSLYYPRSTPELEAIVNEYGFYVEAYPNPFSNSFALHLIAAPDEAVSVNIYDVTGRIVEQYASVNEQTLIGGGLPEGFYHALVMQGNERQVIELVKTN
jgi:PKD repeat protein